MIRKYCPLARFALVVLAVFPVSPLKEQPDEDHLEKWTGTLNAGAAALRINFELIRDDDGKYTGKFISVDQGNVEVPLSNVVFDGDQVTISSAAAQAVYTGRLNEAGDQITGKWKQLGNEFDFTIKRVDSFTEPQHIESWQGTLVAGAQEFDFQIRLLRDEDGELIARLDSFSEGLTGIPVEWSPRDDGFDFEVKMTKARFEGTFTGDKSKIEGHWLQRGGKFPLSFERIDLEETREPGDVPRPQNPEPPYPYDVEEVSYRNEADDLTLAGTLTVPKGQGTFPAMILISGSGPQDRDETIYDHKPFLVIADHLTRNGIAVLRYDERGVGESTGIYAGSTSEDFARDVAAGIEFLKSHSRIEPSKIGLIGHSEGGMVAPMLATERDDIALIVLLAGPGVDGGQIGSSQSKAIAEAAGVPPEVVAAQDRLLTSLFDEMKRTGEIPADDFIDQIVEEFHAALPELPESEQTAQTLKESLPALKSPWFLFFVNYDPQPTLQQVKCPVLAINGTKDLQVLVDLNIDAIENALAQGDNPDYEVHKLENLNHLFQNCETGLMNEYGRIEETFAPAALELITEWILKRVE